MIPLNKHRIEIAQLQPPWLTPLLLFCCAIFTLLSARPAWLAALSLPPTLFESPYPELAVSLSLGGLLLEYWLFQRRKKTALQSFSALADQLEAIKHSKRQLQQKAQRHSSQTEKLKGFIGDRLLEYLEYDEKYLHFKGIAAEIRHNGVISYDKIQQALLTGKRTHPDHSGFGQALTSLGYLWDLLDLSTAENMALHINNYICDCEEYFYQQQLEPNTPLPFEPTFLAHDAIYRALEPCLQQAHSALTDSTETIYLSNPQFQCQLDRHCQLLGNENHIVLAVENLVKNALYFHGGQGNNLNAPCSKIHVSLTKTNQTMQLSVYNRGPHIADTQAQKIYQLGFSTRSEEQVHGKGLGLYFVKQIVDGYEGSIAHRNVNNRPDSYSLRLELQGEGFEGSEIQTEVIEVQITNGSLGCINRTLTANDSDTEQPLAQLSWAFRRPLRSIEITARSNGRTHAFNDLDKTQVTRLLEPSERHPARWALMLTPQPKGSKLCFTPLDVTGVEFIVQLPLANAQPALASEAFDEDTYIETIADRFRPIDQLPDGDSGR